MRNAAVLLAVAACSSPKAPSSKPPIEPVKVDQPAAPVIVDLPGEPNGAWWDPATNSLLLTDDTHHQIVRWSGGTFAPVADVPDAKGLGALVGLPDGRLVVASFGGGKAGGVLIVDQAGKVAPVPNLDAQRRRIGLAVAPDGSVLETYFIKGDGAAPSAGIATIDLATGAEHAIVETGLDKPVGIAATATTIYVTDQRAGTLLSFDRKDPKPVEVVRDLVQPDLLAVLPDGSVVTGSKTGVVYRIANHKADTVTTGLAEVRGVAFDPATRRLFVVERSGATGKLHVLSLP